MSKPKRTPYHIFPLGEGRYKAVWQVGDTIYEAVIKDDYDVERLKAQKNPYKGGWFPYVVVPFDPPSPA